MTHFVNRQLLVGLLVGGSIATGIAWLSRPAPAPVAAPPFKVSGSSVVVTEPARLPVRIETKKVEIRAPLPSSPVSARVLTLESRTSPCYAPLDGRIAEVRVRLGDKVKQGDRLLLVRSGELAVLDKDLKAATLAIATKEALVERLRRLVESRAAPEGDLLVAQSERDEARLNAEAARAKIRSLGVQIEPLVGYWVLATRAGVIVQLDAQQGKQVGPDREHPVATVADLSEVLVLADVPQREASRLTHGGTAEITTPGSSSAPLLGHIDNVADVVDPDRQTVPVRISVGNQDRRLRAASFVEARFLEPGDRKVAILPTSAVVSDGARSVVFVASEDGHFSRRLIDISRRTATEVEVRDGIKPGETVVTEGALLLLSALSGAE